MHEAGIVADESVASFEECGDMQEVQLLGCRTMLRPLQLHPTPSLIASLLIYGKISSLFLSNATTLASGRQKGNRLKGVFHEKG